MKKESFTLVEIIISVMIISILASVALVNMNKAIQTNHRRVCEQNLKILNAAIDIFVRENNALPTTLAMLSDHDIYLAYEKVMGAPKENKLVAFLKNMLGIKSAVAQSQIGQYYGSARRILRCPADPDKSEPTTNPTTFSYAIYNTSSGFQTVADLTAKNVKAIIYDKQDWHKTKSPAYALGISPIGIAGEIVTTGPQIMVKDVRDCDTTGGDDITLATCDTTPPPDCTKVCNALQ